MGVTLRNGAAALAADNDPMRSTLGQMIEPYRAQLAPFLRDGATLERVAAELVLASHKTPHLDRCPPFALVDAVSRALATGGIIGRDVWIVPHKNTKTGVYEPTVMLYYAFKAELVVQAGGARSIDARPVWSNDQFRVTYGTQPNIDHTPGRSNEPRHLTGFYAVAFMGFNHPSKIAYMSIDEVEAMRKRSKQWGPDKVKECPAWYGCARVVHQLVKLLPKNPRLRAVMETIEHAREDEFAAEEDLPVASPPAQIAGAYHGEQAGEDFPAEAPEDATPPKHVNVDLAWAMNYLLPGGSKHWGGFGGKSLGEVTSTSGQWSILRQVMEFCEKDMAKPEHERRSYTPHLHAAASIVLEVRLAEQATTGELPLGDVTPAPRNAIAEGR